MCVVSHVSMLLLLSVSFSYAVAAASRRLLHQPFFPLESAAPAQPPSPPPPAKIPFTTSGNGLHFFPTNPPPPPPPSPSAFATFPANISSLILPNSPKSNHIPQKLLAVSLAASLSAIVIIVVVFVYHRRTGCQHLKPADAKTHRKNGAGSSIGSSTIGISSRVHSSILGAARNGPDRKPVSHSANSEFLYLGTVADSHHVDAGLVRDCSSCNSSEVVSPRILDSPELHPLPPLNRSRSFHDVNPVFVADEDNDDEFYSPKGSIVSTPMFLPVDIHRTHLDSPALSETSVPGSPAMSNSHSPSISFRRCSNDGHNSPMLAPGVSEPRVTSPSPPLVHGSPGCRSNTAWPPLNSESHVMDLGRLSVSSASASLPDMDSRKKMSPASSSSSSPKLSVAAGPAKVQVTMDEVLQASTIPVVEEPGKLGTRGHSLSSSSSPERLSNASIKSSSDNSPVATPLASVPPPPPPPPPFTPLKPSGESPVAVTPKDKPILSRPPPLIPPARPFVLTNSASKISPMELPPADADADDGESTEEGLKPKLKPLHWDKVRASSDREMVWDHLRSSSFKLNEEMIESLFIVNTPAPPKPVGQTTPRLVIPRACQENRVLDPKRAQNIAILLRALNVTNEEVCEALLEGNTDTLGAELLESLLKMAPTKEEERRLKDFKEDSSTKLGQAERFLKAVLDVPFAFKRAEAMLYATNFETEINYLKKSFETLELACEELRNSRMFLKLLETVLKTGNRMNVGTNRGDALAFKLDTLLMLVDVKGADGKTTLLHFVVQEIIRTEGARVSDTSQSSSTTASEDAKCRKLGLQVVAGLSSELAHVKKAATMDSDMLSIDVGKLSKGIQEVGDVVRLIESESDGSGAKFSESINKFVKLAEEEIIKLQAQESVALSLVKEITEYFHGNSAKEEAHPFRIFMVVRDFLGVLDRVCREVGMINERTTVSSAHKFPVPVNPTLNHAFPGSNRSSNSDEESPS